jgi:hypothetical protein
MQALGHLTLVVRLLRAEREDPDAELSELLVRVAEAAGLGRAAARAGDRVPARRQLLVGAAGAGVAEQDRPRVRLVQADGLPGGRPQRGRWNDRIWEMVCRAVVFRDG